jgi:type III pantothenate kinase
MDSSCPCGLQSLFSYFCHRSHDPDLIPNSMNFVIDAGNSYTKMALFQGREMLAFTGFEGIDLQHIKQFCESNPGVSRAIISSVREYPEGIHDFLSSNFRTIFFNHNTSVPILNSYNSPETLGRDRLAGVTGARQLFPGMDILVVDAGTAITYDLITAAGEYLGGAISPGLTMRYKALNAFTGRLPLLDFSGDAALIGSDTESSLHSGVLNGILAEVEGIVKQYLSLYPALRVILTGGDHNYFDKRLNLILDFNFETAQYPS